MSAPAKGKAAAGDPGKDKAKGKSKASFKFPISMGDVTGVFTALGSKDKPTRLMAWFFLLSIAGAGGVLLYGFKRVAVIREYLAQRAEHQHKEAALMEDFLRKQQDAAHRKAVVISAGMFKLELKTDPNQPKVPGISNLAELEIVLVCDEAETQHFIEDNMPRVRNEIVASFIALDRDQILSKTGKEVLRRQILERLNGWLPEGKILEIYFPKLLVT